MIGPGSDKKNIKRIFQWFRNDLSHRKVNIQNQNCIQQNLYFLLLQKIDIKYWKRWYDNNPWLCRLCSKSLKALHVLGLTIFYHFVQYSLTNNNLETLMMWLADEDDILIKIGAKFWTFFLVKAWLQLNISLMRAFQQVCQQPDDPLCTLKL